MKHDTGAAALKRRALRPLALVAVLLLALGTGCTTKTEVRAGEMPAGPRSGPPLPHNATDEAYSHELFNMHQQAVDMADMVGGKEVSGTVRELAAEVGRSRIQQMQALAYLAQSWGIKPHTGDFHGNPGELTRVDLQDLSELDGPAFEDQWLARMTDNYRGSAAMSRAELDGGLSVEGRQYARDAIEALEAVLEELEQEGS